MDLKKHTYPVFALTGQQTAFSAIHTKSCLYRIILLWFSLLANRTMKDFKGSSGKRSPSHKLPPLNLDRPIIKSDYLPPSKLKGVANTHLATVKFKKGPNKVGEENYPKFHMKNIDEKQRNSFNTGKSDSSVQHMVIDEKREFLASHNLLKRSVSDLAVNVVKKTDFGSRISLPVLEETDEYTRALSSESKCKNLSLS